MEIRKSGSPKLVSLFLTAAILIFTRVALAQNPTDSCRLASVIPLAGEEPPAKILIDPPLPGPLASRGVAIIQYCAQNVHLAPVFGQNALTASPRVGHIHVRVDDAPWVWADASGNPVILMGLPSGPHKVTLELENANHHLLDKGSISFVVPDKTSDEGASRQ